jgi:hypothetical protein
MFLADLEQSLHHLCYGEYFVVVGKNFERNEMPDQKDEKAKKLYLSNRKYILFEFFK